MVCDMPPDRITVALPVEYLLERRYVQAMPEETELNMPSMADKACSRCGSVTNGFNRNKKSRDGLASHCKSCQGEQDRKPESRFSQQRGSNRRRGIPWELTLEEYKTLVIRPCEYCELELNPTGSGLDRMEAAKGYVTGNVVPCCATCNMFKARALTYEEMKEEIGPAVRRIRLKRRELGQPEPQSCAYYWHWHKDKVRE